MQMPLLPPAPHQLARRRLEESKRYEERVTFINSVQDWQQRVNAAGNNLIVVEVRCLCVCNELGLSITCLCEAVASAR